MRGDTLSDQLDDATRRFVASDKVVVDRKAKILKVSQMLQWYASDLTNKEFAPRAVSVPGFLADYAGEALLARQLREQKWNVAFIEYDWKLNVRR